MNLANAFQAIEEADAAFSRRIIPAKNLRVVGDYFVAGKDAFSLNNHANLLRICEFLHFKISAGHQEQREKRQLPADYLGSLPNDLRTRLLSHHLEQGIGQAETVVVTKNQQLAAFDRADLVLLAPRKILEASVAELGGAQTGLQVASLNIDAESFCLDLVSPRIKADARPGDTINGGVRITHSLLGQKATEISAYIYRLICQNGAVSRTCLDGQARTRRIPASHPQAHQLQIAQIRRLTQAAFMAVEQRLSGIHSLIEDRFDGPLAIENHFRSLVGAHRLSARRTTSAKSETSQSILTRLMAAWREEGEEPSAFGVVNAITRLATHDASLTTRERYSLFRLGGLLAFQRQHLCPRCFQLLRRELPADAAIHGGTRLEAASAMPSVN